jgi:hypothetical protein
MARTKNVKKGKGSKQAPKPKWRSAGILRPKETKENLPEGTVQVWGWLPEQTCNNTFIIPQPEIQKLAESIKGTAAPPDCDEYKILVPGCEGCIKVFADWKQKAIQELPKEPPLVAAPETLIPGNFIIINLYGHWYDLKQLKKEHRKLLVNINESFLLASELESKQTGKEERKLNLNVYDHLDNEKLQQLRETLSTKASLKPPPWFGDLVQNETDLVFWDAITPIKKWLYQLEETKVQRMQLAEKQVLSLQFSLLMLRDPESFFGRQNGVSTIPELHKKVERKFLFIPDYLCVAWKEIEDNEETTEIQKKTEFLQHSQVLTFLSLIRKEITWESKEKITLVIPTLQYGTNSLFLIFLSEDIQYEQNYKASIDFLFWNPEEQLKQPNTALKDYWRNACQTFYLLSILLRAFIKTKKQTTELKTFILENWTKYEVTLGSSESKRELVMLPGVTPPTNHQTFKEYQFFYSIITLLRWKYEVFSPISKKKFIEWDGRLEDRNVAAIRYLPPQTPGVVLTLINELVTRYPMIAQISSINIPGFQPASKTIRSVPECKVYWNQDEPEGIYAINAIFQSKVFTSDFGKKTKIKHQWISDNWEEYVTDEKITLKKFRTQTGDEWDQWSQIENLSGILIHEFKYTHHWTTLVPLCNNTKDCESRIWLVLEQHRTPKMSRTFDPTVDLIENYQKVVGKLRDKGKELAIFKVSGLKPFNCYEVPATAKDFILVRQ